MMRTTEFLNRHGERFVVEIDPDTGTGTIGGDEYDDRKVVISLDDMLGETMLSSEEVREIAVAWTLAVGMPVQEVLRLMTRQASLKVAAIANEVGAKGEDG